MKNSIISASRFTGRLLLPLLVVTFHLVAKADGNTASFAANSVVLLDVEVGISTNWGDYPGGGSSPVIVPVDAAQGSVFFRLTTP